MSKQTPAVSIIVPCYNEGRLLIVALESIQRQTFQNFEVIIGDDCSTDDTPMLAEDFCRKDSRFRLSVASTNVGMTRNWNRLLKEAEGQFVAKLDADDAYRPQMIARLLSIIQQRQISVAFCRTLDCNEDLQPVGSYYGERAFILRGIEPLEDQVRAGVEWLQLCFDGYQLWHSSSFLASRELLLEINGWDERWGCAADTDLIHRILHHQCSVASIGYAGLLYRRREGSVFDGYKKRNWFQTEVLTILLLSLQRMHESGMPSSLRLKKTWGGLWLARESALSALRSENPQLVAASVAVAKPPALCAALYRCREAVAVLKRRLVR
jgi:glycosyltransferase involved in cell wall biosynthesis